MLYDTAFARLLLSPSVRVSSYQEVHTFKIHTCKSKFTEIFQVL